MVATWVRPCKAPGVAATCQHRETSSAGGGREQTLRRRALCWAGLDSLRRACRARSVPVLGAVPGPGVTAGRARAWGAGRPAKALRRHSGDIQAGRRGSAEREGVRAPGRRGATVQRGGGRGPLRRGEWARHGGRHPCFRWARVAAGASSACALRRATSGSVPTPCRFAPLGATWLFLVE